MVKTEGKQSVARRKVLKVEEIENRKRISFTINDKGWKVKYNRRTRRIARLREEWYRIHCLSKPCRICGGKDHTALSRIEMEDELIHNYNCPVAKWDHWPKAIPESEYSPEMSLEASPSKLAEYLGYGRINIEEALERFELDGEGANMMKEDLDKFKDEVRVIGEEERATWTFKRMSISDE